MSATERTRGTGSSSPDGWRGWRTGKRTVLLDGGAETITLELISDDPPAPFLTDLHTGRVLEHRSTEGVVEAWADGRMWPLGTRPGTEDALTDGQVFVHDGRAFRAHIPETSGETGPLVLDFSKEHPGLELDTERLEATFTGQHNTLHVAGECVRVLTAFARARCGADDSCDGGWLTARDAYDSWLELGGATTSGVDRLGWERGKLRTRLARGGASGLASLFERRIGRMGSELRLAILPDQITWVAARS